ncbi:MAG: GTPase HflX, partial [Gammaproteobacteria bacterium]|nr:GTPase HflX [Gammaproteobacteria bacterium]
MPEAPAERAILVAQLPRAPADDERPLRELGALARSAGAAVCAEVVLARARPVAATLIGKGGARDLGELARARAASLIIIDHPITPVQERNLERIASCRVLDRTGLILDIFAQRATSSEGKLQVELAQLRHLSTRLVRGWSHLERQKGGIGLRGPGETQLETDRRLIGARIKALTRALRRVESQRMLRRRARRRAELPAVSLAGYTNAGKSSLFNRLCGAQVPAADRLFATLDPTMRRLELPGFGAAVLSDTVGFIRELPHALVAAFHSTLEEMASASCLLLVEDQADPERAEHRAAVERVLEEIGAGEVPRIRVYNKMDLAGGRARCRRGRDGRIDRVWLSAHSGDGIDLLRQALAELLGRRRRDYVLRLQPQAGALRARLYQRCDVIDEQIDAAGRIRLKLKMEAADRGWLEA